MQYYLYLLSLPFLYLNCKIIFSDFKYKKIPNKYLAFLLILVPIFYVFSYFYIGEINFLNIFVQFFLSVFVSFLLYYFGVWSAGDAKYLLVLSFFLPYLKVIYFVGNIAFLTIIYLVLYFFYFYFWKSLVNKGYAKSLYKNIYTDLKDSFTNFLQNNNGEIENKKAIYKILKWFLLFLIIFVSIRLLRLYIIHHIILEQYAGNATGFWGFLVKTMMENKSYVISLFFIFFVLFVYFLFKGVNFIRSYFARKFNDDKNSINPLIIDFLLIGSLFSGLIFYIIYEFIKNPVEISQNLKLIFTFYIFMYLLIRILKYSYKITFEMGEQDYIKIEKLRASEIVDKVYLINLFGTQKVLVENNILNNSDPKKYFEKIDNPIDEETKSKLQEIFKIVNNYHKENNTTGFQEIKTIRIFKTFSFGVYIFTGFLVSFLIGDEIFRIIFEHILELLRIK